MVAEVVYPNKIFVFQLIGDFAISYYLNGFWAAFMRTRRFWMASFG
jgi:hypothetical protein